MGRALVAVLALSALGFLAYRAMYGRGAAAPDAVSAPTDRLEAVQKAAKHIEAEQDKQVDEGQKAADER